MRREPASLGRTIGCLECAWPVYGLLRAGWVAQSAIAELETPSRVACSDLLGLDLFGEVLSDKISIFMHTSFFEFFDKDLPRRDVAHVWSGTN
jgi:hypothetical protein